MERLKFAAQVFAGALGFLLIVGGWLAALTLEAHVMGL